jgi:hypothetical protein
LNKQDGVVRLFTFVPEASSLFLSSIVLITFAIVRRHQS